MKKRNFKKLALLGITSGFFVINSSAAQAHSSKSHLRHKCAGPNECPEFIAEAEKSKEIALIDPNSQNMGYHLMTDKEIRMELNDEGLALYNSLDKEQQDLARKVASQRCQGSNGCDRLNACKTDTNECAGKGDCKGKSKCAFSDKNLAVKVVYNKMAKKRADSQNSSK